MLEEISPPTAFVLMRFSGDSWNDETYLAICDVLDKAGYSPLRADQIRTSGPVVEEVCALLREAPLVLIDTSGDSHSVAYELGYAHGIARSHGSTIVLRSRASGQVPFNYSHFRHLIYRDRKHLKQLLRSRLAISMPISGDQLGFALRFSVANNAGIYGDVVAAAILEALHSRRFSGRCEYYAGNPPVNPPLYEVGLAIRTYRHQRYDYEWWKGFQMLVAQFLEKSQDKVMLIEEFSEFCEVAALRIKYMSCGTVEFIEGVPDFVLGEGAKTDSLFLSECQARIASSTKHVPGK